MSESRRPIFRGKQATTTTITVGVPIIAGCIGVHLSWPDATSAGSVVLELSSWPADEAPIGTGTPLAGEGTAWPTNAADAEKWPDSGEVIPAISAGAKGSRLINITNVRQLRARLRITTTANSVWNIFAGISDV